MESVQSKRSSVKDAGNNSNNISNNKASASSSSVNPTGTKPGRKFGLTGQRQTTRPSAGQSSSSSGATFAEHHRFSVRDESRNSWMYSLSEQEMEEKYNATCLAIRTENLTLRQRLEHTHAERDLVENNLSQEVKALHSLFGVLKHEVAKSQQQYHQSAASVSQASSGAHPFRDGLSSGGWNELFVRVANQLDAVHSSAMRISSSAETLGAVEYEARLSAAVQVLILYVDHIKRKWEREHHELEETKRILKESGVNVAQCLAALPDRQQQTQQQGPVSKRRASFPAAPLRRISLRTPPARVTLFQDAAGPASGVEHSVNAALPSPIAEEREDGDGPDQTPKSPPVNGKTEPVAAKAPPGNVADDDTNKKPEANNNESSTSNNNNNNNNSESNKDDEESDDSKRWGASPPVTTRRKGVGTGNAYKSHSWSSGSGVPFNVFANRRSSQEATLDADGRDAAAAADRAEWMRLRALAQWSRARWAHLRRQASLVRTTCRDQWSTVRHRKLELLRYGASVCFLLAAIFSLVVTFVPGNGKWPPSGSLPPNFDASDR